MVNGNLTVKYNPVFVKDLTVDEVGEHYDENGIRSDGLILDYFKETDLYKKMEKEIADYDIIIAPIADNRMFDTIRSFADNAITSGMAIKSVTIGYSLGLSVHSNPSGL